MIKMIRMLEYTFESAEEAEHHFARCAVPLNGRKDLGHMTVRSATLPTTFFDDAGNESDAENVR